MFCITRVSTGLLLSVSMLVAVGSAAQTRSSANPLQILNTNLPPPVARQKYQARLRAIGGQLPYQWSLAPSSKPLPPGLTLDANLGLISGVPQSNQEFSIVVQVIDSGNPPLTNIKLLVASAAAPLSIDWTAKPQLQGANITGALRVSNGSKDDFDLTVIVVAVNEYGRATALRYERFTLAHETESPDLRFTSTLPIGQYVVHADVVAEVPAKNAIYRDRKQQGGLVVQTQ